MLIGDLNCEFSENHLNDFCKTNSLKNIVKSPTCFKNPVNPSCIDLFLTNRPNCFQNTSTIETGISDFHKMVVTVLKIHYKKQKAKVIHYRDYKNFNEEDFQTELNNELSNVDINNVEFDIFNDIVMSVFDQHAPKNKSI